MEGHSQQALLLSVKVGDALEVQKISGLQGAVFEDANGSPLFNDEKAVVAGRPLHPTGLLSPLTTLVSASVPVGAV